MFTILRVMYQHQAVASICITHGCQREHICMFVDTVVRKKSWLRLIRMMSR